MKRWFALILVAVGLLTPVISLVPSANAVDVFNRICSGNNDNHTNAGKTDVCQEKQNSQGKGNPILTGMRDATEVLGFIIGIASVIVIIVSGFRMVTSQGDPQKMATARSAITYALVGVAVSLLAGAIVGLVLNNLK